jgi:hypothetical protein
LRGWFDRELEAGGETHGAQHAQVVFIEAADGITDGADDAGFEIGEAAYMIKD